MLHSRTRRLSALGACLLAGMAVRASAEDGTWVQVAPPAGPSLGGSAPAASVGGAFDAKPVGEAFDAKPIAVRRDSDVALDAAFGGGAAPNGAEPGLLPGELRPEDLQFSETEPAVQVWAQPIAFQPSAGGPPVPPADPTVSGLLDDGSARPADALAAPALVYSEGPTGTWYGEVGAMFLQRSGVTPQVTSVDFFTNAETMNTDDISFAHQTLPRIVVGYQSNNGNRIETIFYGIPKWNDRLYAFPSAGSTLNFPVTSGGGGDLFFLSGNGETQNMSYTSQFINIETNIHTRLSRRRNYSVGLRYMHLNEDMRLQSIQTTFGYFEENYDIYTSNNILMLQLGGEVSSDEYWNRVTFTAAGKAGIGMNFLQQNSEIFDTLFGQPIQKAGAEDVAISSLIDLSLAANIEIHRNVDLKLGYHMLYLSGVALAPEQLDFTTNPFTSQRSLNEKGSVVMQGPSASLQFRW